MFVMKNIGLYIVFAQFLCHLLCEHLLQNILEKKVKQSAIPGDGKSCNVDTIITDQSCSVNTHSPQDCEQNGDPVTLKVI